MPGPLAGALTAGAPESEIAGLPAASEIAGLPACPVEAFRIGVTLQVSVAVPLTCPRQLSSPAVEEISNLSGVSFVGARGQRRRSAPVCLSTSCWIVWYTFAWMNLAALSMSPSEGGVYPAYSG